MCAARNMTRSTFNLLSLARKDYGCCGPNTIVSNLAMGVKLSWCGRSVLLKNDGGILPLSSSKKLKLAIVGDANNVKGGGSGSVWSTHIVSPTEGITARLQNGPHELFSANQAGTQTATDEHAVTASCCPKSGSCPAGFNENASIQGFDLGPPPYPGHPTASAAECCQYCTKTPGCAYCTCLFCCSGGGVPHLLARVGRWLCCSKELFTAYVGVCVGSWNPGNPGSCFPKSAAAKGHSTGGMKGYAWGSNPSPLPPAPPPPPPPPSCSLPLGASGSVVCNQTVFYKSCGMGQASGDSPAYHAKTLYQSARCLL